MLAAGQEVSEQQSVQVAQDEPFGAARSPQQQAEKFRLPALLVDLPGYGYAKTAKSERARWKGLIEDYLRRREALRVAVLLQDLRRDPSEDETLLLDWLAEREIPALVALTKIDKLKPNKRTTRLRDLGGSLPVQADWVIPTSAQTGAGIDELWRAIDTLL